MFPDYGNRNIVILAKIHEPRLSWSLAVRTVLIVSQTKHYQILVLPKQVKPATILQPPLPQVSYNPPQLEPQQINIMEALYRL